MVDKKDMSSNFQLIFVSTFLMTIGFPTGIYSIFMGYLIHDLMLAFFVSVISYIIASTI